MDRLRQPALGILATLLVMVISLGFVSLFDWPTFSGWVAVLLMCTIPTTIVIGVVWGSDYPAFFTSRRQPLRGAMLVLIAMAVGVVVAAVHFFTVGGGISPPMPMLVQCIIVSVVITFWMTIMWGGWPFVLIPNKLIASLTVLAGCYAVNYFLFRIFFSYNFMRDAPIYRPELDPNGLFNAWNATTFAVTCLALMFLLLHFDLWPFTRTPSLMKQPVLGMVWTTVAVVLGAGLFAFGTSILGMAAPTFLVQVPIPFIFGSIIVLNMLSGSLFARYTQPLKGVFNLLAAAVIGKVLALLYGALASTVTGPVVSGAPTFDFEVWLASALLAVTFPFMAYYTDFFQMWPLKKEPAVDAKRTDGAQPPDPPS